MYLKKFGEVVNSPFSSTVSTESLIFLEVELSFLSMLRRIFPFVELIFSMLISFTVISKNERKFKSLNLFESIS